MKNILEMKKQVSTLERNKRWSCSVRDSVLCEQWVREEKIYQWSAEEVWCVCVK